MRSYLTCTYSGENTDNETATVTLANGVKATSVKNLHGSIIKTTVGSQSVTNTYSTTDQKLEKSVDSVAGTTSYGYNDKGSLTTVSGPGLTESYTYDDDKKTLQSKAVTAGGVTHTYQYGHRLRQRSWRASPWTERWFAQPWMCSAEIPEKPWAPQRRRSSASASLI